MRFLKFNAKKGSESVKAPDGWEDVPFSKYPVFLDLCHAGKNGIPDPKEVFKLFFDLSEEMVNSNFRIEQLHAMNEQLNFLTEEPKVKHKGTHFKFREEFIRIPQSISELSLGKYRDIVEVAAEVLQGRVDNAVEMLKTYPEMVAVFIAPEGYTETMLKDLSEEIEKLPTPEVVALGNFFIGQFVNSKHGIKKSWFKKLLTMHKNKPSFPKSLKILVTY